MESLLAEIRSNAPADCQWGAEEINQDVEEAYGTRIDMMHNYPPPTGSAAASPDAPATTVRALIPLPGPETSPAPARQAAAPSHPRVRGPVHSASGGGGGRDSAPCFWAGRPRRRNEELRGAGRAHLSSVSGQGGHESPEACRT